MNLNQVTIPSLDVKKATEFYRKLGLKLIVDALPKYARFSCPDGNSTFSIHQSESKGKSDGSMIYFECEDLDGKVAQLINEGIEFISEPEDQPWLWREAHLNDPDGNHLVLYYAGKNRLNPPWRIN